MNYASLMVVLQLGRSNAAPLAVANDLARRLDVPVTGIARAQPLTVLMGDNFFAGELIQADGEAIEEEAKKAETEFRIALSDHPTRLCWDMGVTSAPLSAPIASAAMTADLIVAGLYQQQNESASSTRRIDVEDIVERAGRPVLAVPPEIGHFGFRLALVAWKESREARRAIADALPLLRLMEKVVIAEVVEPADRRTAQEDLDKMVAWLGRHGVKAVPRLDLGGGFDDGKRLLVLAEEEQAEVIVAGAYSHNRYRERVLGGVTRTLLQQSRRCLLLSR